MAATLNSEDIALIVAGLNASPVKVDVHTIKTQAVACAAGVTIPATIASPTNITAGTITNATNVTNPVTLAASQHVIVDSGSVEYTNDLPPTKDEISTQVAADLLTAHGAGSWVGTGSAGSGAITVPITIQASGAGVAGAGVWITSDESGTTVVAGTLYTDANGAVTFFLSAGDYFVWRQKPGYNFTNPQDLSVS